MREGVFVLCTAVLCACGGEEGIPPPEDCAEGELSYVYELESGGERSSGEGSVTLGNFAFVNALSGENGVLQILDQSITVVHIEFEDLLANGDSVPARGSVTLAGAGIDVGNCETGDFSGTLSVSDDGDTYQFSLVDLHMPPYCDGAAVDGSIAGCYRSQSP